MNHRSVFVALTLWAPAVAQAESEHPVLAVFDLEDGGANLGASVQEQLNEQLVNAFKTSARYRLVSPAVVKQRVAETQKCDRACQAKLGRALGADQALTTRVVRIGSDCVFTSRLSQLRSEKSETATQQGPCTEVGLQRSIKDVVARLIPIAAPDCSGTLGRATFGSKPNGAAVFVNGVELGTTPLMAQKLPADCILQVRLVAPDGRERVENIKLAPNQVSVYNVSFESAGK